jgi:hypothetical protein
MSRSAPAPLSCVRAFAAPLRRHQILWLLCRLVWLFLSSPRVVESSKAYPLGCSTEDSSYYDYDKYPFPPPEVPTKSTDDYFLVERLGTGKFSDVFSAVEAREVKLSVEHGVSEIDPKSLVVIKVPILLWPGIRR